MLIKNLFLNKTKKNKGSVLPGTTILDLTIFPIVKLPRRKSLLGFTLLEILLVVGIISILAGIVIIAINPGRQLANVRNTERSYDIKQIYNAVDQYYIDYSNYPSDITGLLTEICDTGSATSTHSIDCTGLVDLSILVPTYLTAIPRDPQGSTLSFIPQVYATTNGTGYQIMKNIANKIIIRSAQTEIGKIVMIGDPIPTDNLVSFWSFDNTVIDSKGANNGTIIGNVTSAAGVKGVPGTAYYFAGDGDYISLTYKPNFVDPGARASFSLWIKPEDLINNQGIMFFGVDYYGALSIDIYNDNLRFYWNPNHGGEYVPVPTSVLEIDEWSQITFTFDDFLIKAYINGQLYTSRTFSGANQNSWQSEIYWGKSIGAKLFSTYPWHYDTFFRGSIDNFRIYGRVLTADEVANIYLMEKA